MGTSGNMAFVIDGETKAGYVHFDSYPSGLGADMLEWLRENYAKPETYAAVQALKVVDDSSTPTPEQIEALKQYANTNVSTKQLNEWYVLLRETQGDPADTLAAGYTYGANRVEKYRLGYFGEYTYVADFDAKEFIAEGYGKSLGRWPFDALPTRDEFLKLTENDEDED
jgi:hypothetical protein